MFIQCSSWVSALLPLLLFVVCVRSFALDDFDAICVIGHCCAVMLFYYCAEPHHLSLSFSLRVRVCVCCAVMFECIWMCVYEWKIRGESSADEIYRQCVNRNLDELCHATAIVWELFTGGVTLARPFHFTCCFYSVSYLLVHHFFFFIVSIVHFPSILSLFII